MKKFVKIILIVFGLLIGALYAIPQLFKDDILKMVQDEADKMLKAELIIEDVSVSIIRHFPKITFELNGLKIKGEGEFEGVNLVEVGAVELAIALNTLISDEGFSLDGLYIVNPKMDVRVLESGLANYDVMEESEEGEAPVEEDTTATSSDFNLKVKEYGISNGVIAYSDATMDMQLLINGLNHTGTGDFSLSQFDLGTSTTIDSTYFAFEGVPYLNHVRVALEAVFGFNMDEFEIQLKENKLNLNNLKMAFKGDMKMGDESSDFNISFNALDNRFSDLMSLVPAVYAEGTEGFKISGTFGISGQLVGAMTETSMPGFGVQLSVDNGRVLVADMPKAIQNINIGVNIVAPESPEYKNMSVNVNKFHAEMAGNPIDASLLIKEALGDPKISAKASGAVDFGNLKDVLPLEEGQKLQGKIDLNMSAKMVMSDIENEDYDKVDFQGVLNAKNILFQMADMPMVQVFESSNTFSPQQVTSKARLNYGKSDLSWDGQLDNLLGFALADGVLKGNLDLQSSLMDLNEMMGEDVAVEEQPTETVDTSALEVVRLPKNLDLSLNANIKKALFENYDIRDIHGNIGVEQGKVVFHNTGMKMFGGQLKLNGVYAAPEGEEEHYIDLAFSAQKMDVQQTTTTVATIQKLVPIAKACEGKYGAGFSFKSDLQNDYSPVLNSINGSGLLEALDVIISGGPLGNLSEKLGLASLSKQVIREVKMNFEVKDGRLNVKPFPVVLDEDIRGKVQGSNLFDGTIDYTMNLEIPKGKAGGEVAGLLDGVAKQVQSLGGSWSPGDVIKVDVGLTGPYNSPKVSLKMPGLDAGGVKDALKDKAKEKVDAEKERLKNELDAKKKAAEEEARKKLEEEKRKLEEKRKKAEEEARRKMEEEKQKMKDKAKNKMKDMFGNPK